MKFLRKPLTKRLLLGAASLAIVVATFVYFLPTIANYGQVWDVVRDLSWQQILLLFAATAINLVTFAPPWMAALPGLSFIQAFTMTQASTALSIVVPGGIANVAYALGRLGLDRIDIALIHDHGAIRMVMKDGAMHRLSPRRAMRAAAE